MTQDAYDVLTLEQITTLQQERYDRWIAIINAPPEPEVVPTEPEPEVVPTEPEPEVVSTEKNL